MKVGCIDLSGLVKDDKKSTQLFAIFPTTMENNIIEHFLFIKNLPIFSCPTSHTVYLLIYKLFFSFHLFLRLRPSSKKPGELILTPSNTGITISPFIGSHFVRFTHDDVLPDTFAQT